MDRVRSIDFESSHVRLSAYRFDADAPFRIVFDRRGTASTEVCVPGAGFARLLVAVTHTETIERRRTRLRWPPASQRATLRIRSFAEQAESEVLEIAEPATFADTAVILRPYHRGAFVRETWRFPHDVGALLRGGCEALGAR